MKAILYRSYGDASVLESVELPRPVAGPGQLLLRVCASSVNPVDWKIASGKIRLVMPAKFPQVPGYDVAGEVLEVGAGVAEFTPGMKVHARLAKDLEPYRLFWLEDATPAENQDAFRLIRQHSTTPLAVGEVFNTLWDCKELIQQQLIDYIRATVVHAGGISHLRKIFALAEVHGVRAAPHGPSDVSQRNPISGRSPHLA